MASILKPFNSLFTGGQVKPQGIPTIDWMHPLAQGLIFYAIDIGVGAPVELVQDIPAVYGTGGATPVGSTTPWGSANRLKSSNFYNPFFYAPDSVLNITAPSSVAMGFVLNSTTVDGTAGFGRFANNTANNALVYGGSSLTYAAGMDTSLTYTPNTNQFNVAVGVMSGTGSLGPATLYANGTQAGTNASVNTTLSTAATNNIVWGSKNSSPSNVFGWLDGWIFFGAFWNRPLTAAEVLQLYLDPYCFLVSPEGEMETLFSPSNVGVSGIAWAFDSIIPPPRPLLRAFDPASQPIFPPVVTAAPAFGWFVDTPIIALAPKRPADPISPFPGQLKPSPLASQWFVQSDTPQLPKPKPLINHEAPENIAPGEFLPSFVSQWLGQTDIVRLPPIKLPDIVSPFIYRPATPTPSLLWFTETNLTQLKFKNPLENKTEPANIAPGEFLPSFVTQWLPPDPIRPIPGPRFIEIAAPDFMTIPVIVAQQSRERSKTGVGL